jgi:hypothetical protein
MGRERHPEVIYLPAIFRDIRAGKIRVPAFQRGYVWEKSKGLELLDSVRKGYPIGSLLFWEADVTLMKTEESKVLPLPRPEVTGDVDFVLDGMQRISTLFGAFHDHPFEASREENIFAVLFDFLKDRFVTVRDETESCIDLRKLFNPKELLAEQARFGKLPGGDKLVDGTIDLLRQFQEYLVPVIRIGDRDPAVVVQIFERVNSTATRLGAVDFMRALTWHKDFDLTIQLDKSADVFGRRGWDIPQSFMAKAVASHLGVVPKSDQMVKLRGRKSEELKSATKSVEAAILRVMRYLEETVGIFSMDYVPYEGQFLTLVALATTLDEEDFPDWVATWFWKTGFSEWFFGKPDTSISLGIDSIKAAPSVDPSVPFRLTAETLVRRQQRKGGAVAMTVTAVLARDAHSVLSGADISPLDLLKGYRTSGIGALFTSEELAPVFGMDPRTDKFVANAVLLSPSEERMGLTPAEIRRSVLQLAQNADGERALATQCINAQCIAAIKNGDPKATLYARAAAIVKVAEGYSGVA